MLRFEVSKRAIENFPFMNGKNNGLFEIIYVTKMNDNETFKTFDLYIFISTPCYFNSIAK